MPGKSVPFVLFPRYTTFVGVGTFPTLPIPASAYANVVLDVWRGPVNGTGAGAAMVCEESNDLQAWTPCGTSLTLPSPLVETQYTRPLSKAWMRFSVSLTGTQPAMTCYVEGHFELREKGPGA